MRDRLEALFGRAARADVMVVALGELGQTVELGNRECRGDGEIPRRPRDGRAGDLDSKLCAHNGRRMCLKILAIPEIQKLETVAIHGSGSHTGQVMGGAGRSSPNREHGHHTMKLQVCVRVKGD
jgi:hypothetical protein